MQRISLVSFGRSLVLLAAFLGDATLQASDGKQANVDFVQRYGELREVPKAGLAQFEAAKLIAEDLRANGGEWSGERFFVADTVVSKHLQVAETNVRRLGNARPVLDSVQKTWSTEEAFAVANSPLLSHLVVEVWNSVLKGNPRRYRCVMSDELGNVSSFMFNENGEILNARYKFVSLSGTPQKLVDWTSGGDKKRGYFETTTKKERVSSLAAVYADDYSEWSKLSRKQIQEVSERKDAVVVAVLDTGLDYNHPALAMHVARPELSKEDKSQGAALLVSQLGLSMHPLVQINTVPTVKKDFRLLRQKHSVGWDFEYDDEEPFDSIFGLIGDDIGHGTAVAGEIVKVAPSVRLLPVRINKGSATGTSGEILEAVRFAHQRGARVVNMSFRVRGEKYVAFYEKLFAAYPDILFVAAAGNDSVEVDGKEPVVPASVNAPNLLVVTAADAADELCGYANYSKKRVHLAVKVPASPVQLAPRSRSGGLVRSEKGTSYAAPVVAGMASEAILRNPKLKPAEVIELFRLATRPSDDLRVFTVFGGVPDLQELLRLATKSK